MTIGLLMSLGVIGLQYLGVDSRAFAEGFLGKIDFGETLMKGMLSILLFAGALKININDLAQQKFVVATLATVGVILTTFLVGSILYMAFYFVNLSLPYIYCLVFGALIAPTDPVAVLSLLKTVKTSKSLETKIAGESLFNDGVGVVVFTVVAGLAVSSGSPSMVHIVTLFFEEAVGGVVFGLALGLVGYFMLKDVDDHLVEILITLALVCGGYALAMKLHTSGPIAIVVTGLLIGNYGRRFAMSDNTRKHLDQFWELIDELLNTVLFLWIGLEILILSFSTQVFLIGLLAIPVTLGARLFSVWLVVNSLKFRRQFSDRVIRILTWGGLRGGISIALALSLPPSDARDIIVAITYVVVVFSILVQGLTIKKVAQPKIKIEDNTEK
jgi:Na+:H+ antiporter